MKLTEREIKAIKKDKKNYIIRALDMMDDKERYEIISRYCKSCGSKDKGCNCWNDE